MNHEIKLLKCICGATPTNEHSQEHDWVECTSCDQVSAACVNRTTARLLWNNDIRALRNKRDEQN
jgi:hypothetical protein